jgi:hypothetical protein
MTKYISRYKLGVLDMKKLISYTLCLLLIALLTGCGGGTQSATTGGTIKAVIKTSALSANLNIGGIQMTIALPNGVKPTETSSLEFISATPANYKLQKLTYNATDSVLEFSVIDLAGFSTEDQIVLHLIVSPGTIPVKTDFSIKSYNFFDNVTGASISGLNPTLTTIIQ